MAASQITELQQEPEMKFGSPAGTVFLMYHELEILSRKLLNTSTTYGRYVVRQSDFQTQVNYLTNHQWRSLSVSEALVNLKRKKGVVFTFDDGCESDFIAAAPILKDANFNATFYVVAGWLEKPGYLSIRQLRELQAMGFEIGCHSMTHPNLTEVEPNRLSVEIGGAKKKLEDILGRTVDHFSAPYGFWNPKLAAAVSEAGYLSAATSQVGANSPATDIFNLNRVVMLRRTTLRDFSKISKGRLFGPRIRQSILRIPKSILGSSKYLQFVSLSMRGK